MHQRCILVGESDGTGGSTARGVNDGPQSAVRLRDQADAASRQDTRQGDGAAKVGSGVLDTALEGSQSTIDDGKSNKVIQLALSSKSLATMVARVSHSPLDAAGGTLASVEAALGGGILIKVDDDRVELLKIGLVDLSELGLDGGHGRVCTGGQLNRPNRRGSRGNGGRDGEKSGDAE